MTPSSPPRRHALKCGVSSRPRLAVSSTPAPRLPTAPPPPASLLSPPLASRLPPKLRLFPLLVPVKTAPCPRVPLAAPKERALGEVLGRVSWVDFPTPQTTRGSPTDSDAMLSCSKSCCRVIACGVCVCVCRFAHKIAHPCMLAPTCRMRSPARFRTAPPIVPPSPRFETATPSQPRAIPCAFSPSPPAHPRPLAPTSRAPCPHQLLTGQTRDPAGVARAGDWRRVP